MTIAIHWFRQDLRCHDNPALNTACVQHKKIIPLYIFDKITDISLGGAQRWWLHHSLTALELDLQEKNLDLCLRQGEALTVLMELIKNYSIDTVYWNRCYEPEQIKRDQAIKAALKALGIDVISMNGSLLSEPWTLKNQSGDYFKVFTPFWKQCLKQITLPDASIINTWPSQVNCVSEKLSEWNLLPVSPDWAVEFSVYWQPGEAGAAKKLNHFIDSCLDGYKAQRNEPAKDATSRLSPHLHFGEISIWQVWRAIADAKQQTHCDLQSADHFLSELGWREFSYYLLYHFPALPKANFKRIFDDFPWQSDDDALKLWQKGLTGYPIIDAGMRELWRTGYMHNRVRMIVASFLVKDLFIDWRCGADWFLDTLVDADLANNSASWQWVAGSGADAAPYFRIFNPVLQSEKFDPEGIYIKKWIPELTLVKTKWIHEPWQAPAGELNIVLGKDYPHRIVEHAKARDLALANYKALKN